jgi:hypothetical protein
VLRRHPSWSIPVLPNAAEWRTSSVVIPKAINRGDEEGEAATTSVRCHGCLTMYCARGDSTSSLSTSRELCFLCCVLCVFFNRGMYLEINIFIWGDKTVKT